MVNRLVSVGDDFTLPPAVLVGEPNLPERLSEAAQNATFVIFRHHLTGEPVAGKRCVATINPDTNEIIDFYAEDAV